MSNQTVLITGASQGIGAACARAFAGHGAFNLVLNGCSHADDLKALGRSLEETAGSVVLTSVGDISDEAYVDTLFEQIDKTFGGLDIVISNAGVDKTGLIQDFSLNDWNRLFAVNVTGAFLVSRRAIPLMLRKHSGSLLFMSSVYAKTGAAYEAAYAATKGALNALTLSLSRELSPNGIKVNALCPGAVDTAMNSYLSREEKAALIEDIPMGRLCRPEEVAELAYDTSVNHPYLTGQLISLTGGWN